MFTLISYQTVNHFNLNEHFPKIIILIYLLLHWKTLKFNKLMKKQTILFFLSFSQNNIIKEIKKYVLDLRSSFKLRPTKFMLSTRVSLLCISNWAFYIYMNNKKRDIFYFMYIYCFYISYLCVVYKICSI